MYCSHVRLCARVDDSVQEFGNFQEEDFEGPVQHFDEGKCLDHVANPVLHQVVFLKICMMLYKNG